jgi:hypothetical protein
MVRSRGTAVLAGCCRKRRSWRQWRHQHLKLRSLGAQPLIRRGCSVVSSQLANPSTHQIGAKRSPMPLSTSKRARLRGRAFGTVVHPSMHGREICTEPARVRSAAAAQQVDTANMLRGGGRESQQGSPLRAKSNAGRAEELQTTTCHRGSRGVPSFGGGGAELPTQLQQASRGGRTAQRAPGVDPVRNPGAGYASLASSAHQRETSYAFVRSNYAIPHSAITCSARHNTYPRIADSAE